MAMVTLMQVDDFNRDEKQIFDFDGLVVALK